VTDTVTGLIWLRDASCFAAASYFLPWVAANQAAASLANGQCGLTDESAPGDWRLPTKGEWEATVGRAVSLGCLSPALVIDVGDHCFTPESSSFTGVYSNNYWSSTTYEPSGFFVWRMELGTGRMIWDDYYGKRSTYAVWPVRSR
jgi:hypothetical protein